MSITILWFLIWILTFISFYLYLRELDIIFRRREMNLLKLSEIYLCQFMNDSFSVSSNNVLTNKNLCRFLKENNSDIVSFTRIDKNFSEIDTKDGAFIVFYTNGSYSFYKKHSICSIFKDILEYVILKELDSNQILRNPSSNSFFLMKRNELTTSKEKLIEFVDEVELRRESKKLLEGHDCILVHVLTIVYKLQKWCNSKDFEETLLELNILLHGIWNFYKDEKSKKYIYHKIKEIAKYLQDQKFHVVMYEPNQFATPEQCREIETQSEGSYVPIKTIYSFYAKKDNIERFCFFERG